LIQLASASVSGAVAEFGDDTGRNHELAIRQTCWLLVTNRSRDAVRHAVTGAFEQTTAIRIATQSAETATGKSHETAISVAATAVVVI